MGNCSDPDSKNQKEYFKSLSEIDSIINDPSLTKISSEKLTYSDIHYFVMIIQTNYRRYIARKKYKEKLLNKLEYKKNLLKSSITFKESWELYFNNNNEYEFSFKGLQSLTTTLIDFYKNFFNYDLIKEGDISISNIQIKKFNFESLMKSDFRTTILIYLSKTFYLGDKIENRIQNSEIFFESIKKNEEFMENDNINLDETFHVKNKKLSFDSLSDESESEPTSIYKKNQDNNDNEDNNKSNNFFFFNKIPEISEKSEIKYFRKEKAKKKKNCYKQKFKRNGLS